MAVPEREKILSLSSSFFNISGTDRLHELVKPSGAVKKKVRYPEYTDADTRMTPIAKP
jgi:hypothetical protein